MEEDSIYNIRWTPQLLSVYIRKLNQPAWYPAGWSDFQKRKLDRRVATGEFRAHNNRLYWRNKEVISETRIEAILTQLYQNEAFTQNSRDKFYRKIKDLYWGISQSKVMAFLKKQESWQLIQPHYEKQMVYRPVMSRVQNVLERVQLDHIQLEPWNGYKYVLVAIDCFSRYAWTWPVRDKSMVSVIACLEPLVQRLARQGRHIDILMGDNAFGAARLQAWLAQQRPRISFAHGRPYRPQTTGGVERVNRTLKQKLWGWMIRRGNMRDWVSGLPIITQNYNHTYHTSIKATPEQAFLQPNYRMVMANRASGDKMLERAEKYTKRLKSLVIGDPVRISLWAFSATARKGLGKRYKPQWTPEVFTVWAVNGEPGREFYRVADAGRGGNYYKRWYPRNDLLKVER